MPPISSREEMMEHVDDGNEFSHKPLVGLLAIRLLELHAGQSGDDIHCTIIHDSLETGSTNRHYVALSYVWGDPTFTRSIFCNGTRFHITPKLEGALRGLRRREESRILWIDQICIDQLNNDERCAQIRIMKDIYYGADHVIAWLGESTTDTNAALQFVRILEEHLMGNNPGWLAFAKFLALPWFSRVWVVQEAMVAKSLVFQWGSNEISWETISGIVSKLENSHILGALVLASPSSQPARFLISRIQGFKSCRIITLHHLLAAFNSRDSTDPRDKIYALLGLIRNAPGYGIDIDYTIPDHDLLRFVAKAMIEENQSLRLLDTSLPGPIYTRVSPLPSWCPNWCQDFSLERPKTSIYEFQADGSVKASIFWHEDPNLLTVRGKLVDTVGDQMIPFDPPLFIGNKDNINIAGFNYARYMANFLESCNSLAYSASHFPSTKTDMLVLWRTLIGSLDITQKLAGNVYSGYHKDYETYVQDCSQTSAWLNSTLLSDWPLERKEGAVAYSRCIVAAGNGRQFTAMRSGRLGWVRSQAQRGDRVAVLYGSNVPWVLRPFVEGRWKLICQCYVEGIMGGEMTADNGLEAEDITLC
ncbi:heterokaryon incompatibility protein-domain-containing protein [Hyaloscypha finlandica]|nr:heterokaryon incompatibility protein-domain-containing protein [Hyaloscypha finlandica]